MHSSTAPLKCWRLRQTLVGMERTVIGTCKYAVEGSYNDAGCHELLPQALCCFWPAHLDIKHELPFSPRDMQTTTSAQICMYVSTALTDCLHAPNTVCRSGSAPQKHSAKGARQEATHLSREEGLRGL